MVITVIFMIVVVIALCVLIIGGIWKALGTQFDETEKYSNTLKDGFRKSFSISLLEIIFLLVILLLTKNLFATVPLRLSVAFYYHKFFLFISIMWALKFLIALKYKFVISELVTINGIFGIFYYLLKVEPIWSNVYQAMLKLGLKM